MRTTFLTAWVALISLLGPQMARAQDLSAEAVLRSIDRGRDFLISQQRGDGSWVADPYGAIGPTSLAVLALINSGMSPDERPLARGLDYLRSIREADFHAGWQTYEVSLVIMALAAAKTGARDITQITLLAQALENGQIINGERAGMWAYRLVPRPRGGGDHSNTQFAVLGLREAAFAGVPIDPAVWNRIARHWLASQQFDGGWNYAVHGEPARGSMTVAGIASLNIIKSVLRDDELSPDGTPNCCDSNEKLDIVDQALERAYDWMAENFSARSNPGHNGSVLYYLYGLERAGRLSGRRFFGNHDWYREGADYLLDFQTPRDGSWIGRGIGESNPVIGTSFALLFLSKGLAPVLINKLAFGDDDETADWNLHPNDVRNLTSFITTRPKWPKLVTWQTLELQAVTNRGSVGDLLQAPILYITGREAPPDLTPPQAELLRSYINQGGFIFAAAGCDREAFTAGMRDLVGDIYPNGEGELKRLPPEHPIYRAEYLLDGETVELWGVQVGCRTTIVYAPDDLGCLWEMWLPHDPPDRPAGLVGMITQKMRIGVNVVAYATGREPPSKLEANTDFSEDENEDVVRRGLLQVAELRHGGNWQAAPRAVHNLMVALNELIGLTASTRSTAILATDPDLYKYPLVIMHGRTAFTMSPQEIEALRTHLDRGAVLFADACCASPEFDASFRDLVRRLYPEKEFKRIPTDHEMFTTVIGADLSQIRRRAPGGGEGGLNDNIIVGAPFLEGIEVEGRYSVIYSRYDISCALEKQASAACEGYLPESALKLAINIVLYSMLQDVAMTE